MDRRHLLQTFGGMVAPIAVAGCSTDDEPDDSDSGGVDDATDTEAGSTDEPADEDTETPTESGSDAVLELVSHEWYEEDYSAGVQGEVKNVSDETLDYVAVEVAFYDADGAKLEDGLDNTKDLKPDTVWKFDAMYPDTDTEAVDDYEITVSDSPF